MEIFTELTKNPDLCIALGFFDGVHLGHRAVIESTVNYARCNGKKSAIITFWDHPCCYFKGICPEYILPREAREEKIKELLRRLGAAPNYTGFHYLVEAVLLCTEEESKLLSVTKTLYPETARHFSVSPSAIERDIRTVIKIIWQRNQSLLNEIAGYQLTKQPTASQLLSIIVGYMSLSGQNL